MGCVYSTLGTLFPSLRKMQIQTALERLSTLELKAANASREVMQSLQLEERQIAQFANGHRSELATQGSTSRAQLQQMLVDIESKRQLMQRTNDTLGHLRTAVGALRSQLATEHAGEAAHEVASLLSRLGIDAASIAAQGQALEDGTLELRHLRDMSNRAVPPLIEEDRVVAYLQSLSVDALALAMQPNTETDLHASDTADATATASQRVQASASARVQVALTAEADVAGA